MKFTIGDRIRYKPGTGTYGYEHVLEVDGRVPGVVVGFSSTRVRVELDMGEFGRRRRCVDAGSLAMAPPPETWSTCPTCGARSRDAVPTPGVVHRTQLCSGCTRKPAAGGGIF